MIDKNIYVELDEDILRKLHKFKGLTVEHGLHPSDKVKHSLKHILSVDSPTMKETQIGPVNTFKGMFIKITRHYAGVGYRTEIGLIFQDYVSKSSGRHFVDYIIVDEETGQYMGRVENYILSKNGTWTMSCSIENLEMGQKDEDGFLDR